MTSPSSIPASLLSRSTLKYLTGDIAMPSLSYEARKRIERCSCVPAEGVQIQRGILNPCSKQLAALAAEMWDAAKQPLKLV